MSPIESLKKAFAEWFHVFKSSMDAVPVYAQFASACYKELVKNGVPSAEAAMMSVEILKIHIGHWFKREVPSDTQRQILENFVPTREH